MAGFGRSISAPVIIVPPQLQNRPAPPVYEPGYTASDDIAAEIDQLLKKVVQISIAMTAAPESTAQAFRSAEGDSWKNVDLSRTIADLLDDELDNAAASQDEARLLQALAAALQLVPGTTPEHRHASFQKMAAQLARTSGGSDVQRFAAELIRTFALHPRSSDPYLLNASAELFANKLLAAADSFSFASQCRMVVHLMNAAVPMKCYVMAKTAIDELMVRVRVDPVQKRTERIIEVAGYTVEVPEKFRSLVSMKLYLSAPKEAGWRLPALEAIADNSNLLLESKTTTELCKTLNQEIYQLRIAQAANPPAKPAEKN